MAVELEKHDPSFPYRRRRRRRRDVDAVAPSTSYEIRIVNAASWERWIPVLIAFDLFYSREFDVETTIGH